MDWIDHHFVTHSIQLQVQYGLLLLCAAKGGSWFCLVQEFGELQVNQSPMLVIAVFIMCRTITSLTITRSVSIVQS